MGRWKYDCSSGMQALSWTHHFEIDNDRSSKAAMHHDTRRASRLTFVSTYSSTSSSSSSDFFSRDGTRQSDLQLQMHWLLKLHPVSQSKLMKRLHMSMLLRTWRIRRMQILDMWFECECEAVWEMWHLDWWKRDGDGNPRDKPRLIFHCLWLSYTAAT